MGIYLLLILVILLSALFSGLEMAYVSSDKLKLMVSENKNSITQKVLFRFIQNPDKFICSMLVGNNLALTAYGLFFSVIINSFPFDVIGSGVASLVIGTILSTVVILIFGEFLPKSIFQNIPNLLLKFLAIPVQIIYIVLYPITFIFMSISNLLLYGFKGKNTSSRNLFSRIDLLYFIEGVEGKSEDYQKDDLSVIKNALAFNGVKLRDCMVPRIDIEAMEVNCSIEDLKEKFINSSFSKVLIYRDSPDQMIGYVHLKDIFQNPDSIKAMLISMPLFSEATSAKEVLNVFLEDRKSVAIVLDEFGGVSGMVTIEDLVEEIFGEIQDEHDIEEDTEKQIATNKYLFSARLEVDYLNQKYGLKIPVSADYETLSGYIIYNYESIPKAKESIGIDNYKITIQKVLGNKVDTVLFTILESKQ